MAQRSTSTEDTTEEKAQKQPKPTAGQVVEEYNRSWTYINGVYAQRWHDAWSIVNNRRINRGYEGVADTFIPLTFSILESTKANVVGGRPKITFMPTTPEQDGDTKILDACVMYVWDKGYYQLRVTDWVDGALTYGSSILMESWDPELDIPVATFIPIKDFWIDPAASSIEMAEREGLPCGYRYLTTKEALKSRTYANPEYDDSKPEGKSNQRILNYYNTAAIDSAGNMNANDTDAADKNMWQGSTLGEDASKHQVEVIVRYLNGHKTEVINRRAIIYDGDAELEDMYPFAPLYDFKDPSLFYGRGHVDILKQRQEELNDVDNQDTDNMSYQLDAVKTIDPAYEHLIPQIVSAPGVVVPVPAGSLAEMPKPGYNPKAHEKRQEIKDDMREAVGAGEIVQGVVADTQKTATEINAVQLNAGKRFDLMIQQMETGGFQRLAKLIFKFIQKYGDKEFVIRTVGTKGVRFEKFLKEQFPGEWDPRVQLDASAKTEQARTAQLQGQMFTQYAQNPLINLLELTKLDMRKQYGLDDQEIELLLSNPGQMGEAQPTDGTAAPAAAMASMGAAGPPMLGAGPVAAGPPPPGGGAAPTDQAGLTPADYVKLYAAAASAGDTSTMDQAVERLGLIPPDQMPVGIRAKHVQAADTHIKTAMSLQKQQHDMEQAAMNQALAAQNQPPEQQPNPQEMQ